MSPDYRPDAAPEWWGKFRRLEAVTGIVALPLYQQHQFFQWLRQQDQQGHTYDEFVDMLKGGPPLVREMSGDREYVDNAWGDYTKASNKASNKTSPKRKREEVKAEEGKAGKAEGKAEEGKAEEGKAGGKGAPSTTSSAPRADASHPITQTGASTKMASDPVIHLSLFDDPSWLGPRGRLELQRKGFAQLQNDLTKDAVRRTLGLYSCTNPRIREKTTGKEVTTREQFDKYVGDAEVVEFVIDRHQESTAGSARPSPASSAAVWHGVCVCVCVCVW